MLVKIGFVLFINVLNQVIGQALHFIMTGKTFKMKCAPALGKYLELTMSNVHGSFYFMTILFLFPSSATAHLC